MTPSPIHEIEETLFEPSVDRKESHIESVFTSEFETQTEPLTFQRQDTPSPIRESFVQETHTTDDFHVSSARPNEASKSQVILLMKQRTLLLSPIFMLCSAGMSNKWVTWKKTLRIPKQLLVER